MTANSFELPDLPIKACLEEIANSLKSGHVTLSASTGSGKTTVVPVSLLKQSWLAGKKIIMLEPRRPAARMAARRMAFLVGETVGKTIGYQVRFERKISRQTRIEVLTEGLLLKRLQADPELNDVGLVIFDEFHERNLVADLSLALCIDVCNGLREDLRLLVMSASLDTGSLTQLINARHIATDGKLHPVTTQYASQDLPLNKVIDACMPLIEQALNIVNGDVLVFLPGRGEINRLQSVAEQRWGDDSEVLTLSGDLSSQQQDRVLNPTARKCRRLILTTDIAETSLTIEGIEAVVDGGRVRKPVFQPDSGLTRLETRWISKASALQRSGRAGRLGPGHCFRAWTEARQQRLEEWIPAEILQADLATTVLELAAWGVNDPAKLAWLDIPPQGHWQQAVDLLQQLQAIDMQGHITRQGQEMSALPVHPRLAHMLLNANDQQQAADLAAILSDRDPFIRKSGNNLPADIGLRLSVLTDWRHGTTANSCDIHRLKQLDRLSQQFLRLLGSQPTNASQISEGALLALAYPDRVAKRRSQGGTYLMRNGRGVLVPLDDSLAASEYLVIADMDAGHRDGRAWLAARIDLHEIEHLFANQVQYRREVLWDKKHQKVMARKKQLLGEIILAEQQVPLQPDDAVINILLEQVKTQGLALFGKQDKWDVLRARIETIRQLDQNSNRTEDWPDVSDEGLIQCVEQWLLPWLDKVDSLKQVKQVNLYNALQAWLGWEKQQQLDKLLPLSFSTPAGSQRRIEYDLVEKPLLRVPLQEMLGVSESPSIANGRLNLVIHLLSPAGRSLQVTSDLQAFWNGAYQQVKKEMRGRYPKHFWPDNPADAEATRFTKKRHGRS